MHYVSPFQDLGLDIVQNLEKSDLNLAKKRLLAELDLSSETTLKKEGMELTKNDIIYQFDRLATVKNWDFHRLVFVDKSLLELVQNFKWQPKNALLDEPKYDNPDFVEFVSPYVNSAYKSLIIRGLHDRIPDNISAILDIHPRLLTDEDHDDVWYSVESYLDGFKENLDEIAENVRHGKTYSDHELKAYHGNSFMQCLNLLPEEFGWFRADYATSLYNLSANSWNKDKHYRALFLVKEAALLDISEDTKQMIEERIEWFETELNRINAPTESSNNSDMGTIGRVILFAIFMMIRMATCSNNSVVPTYNFEPSNPTIYTPSSVLNDTLMERTVRQTLFNEGVKSKKWDKKRFDAIMAAIKKTSTESQTKLTNSLLIDKCLIELEKLKDLPDEKRTMKLDQIYELEADFKVLQAERGLL
jgi:hypothetical protein